ncbi:MAG: T9SS type A sorting domain-containing protein [Bacteroidota bacterium]
MFKSKINTIILICLFLIGKMSSFSQEELRPLSGNINLPNIITPNVSNQLNKISALPTLDTIPFFDDFSYATKSNYPTYKHWLDSNVYVNTGFPIAPISIGVATFDGLNKLGYPYNILAPASSSRGADTLTSRPINIEKKGAVTYSPADSLYLSFYVQAKGRGNAPEASDALTLEFYNAQTKLWEKIWTKSGYNPNSSDTLFKRVMIPIKKPDYFDSLFQFRFTNKATISGSLDHWHLDYVYLNKNRTINDTLIEDVTFGYMSTSFLKNYSTMPYRQFVPSEMATNIKNYLRNNSNIAKTKTYQFNIYQETSGTSLFNYSGGTNPILPFQQNGWHKESSDFNPNFSYVFPTLTDSTFFRIVHTAISTPDNVRTNDTLTQIQKLTNYYAYDDGTAEQGYYLNTAGAKIAVRFTLNKNDTIKALNIYFDPIIDGAAIVNSSFRILIWADGGGAPSITNVIYKDSLMRPKYLKGKYNLIPTYKLTSCLLLNAGTYYFGIQQTSNLPLNIGFDKNTNHKDALYYDIGSGWTQSAIPGSIMINPIIGCYEPPIIVGLNEIQKTEEIILFPNPAQDYLTIQSKTENLENVQIKIINSIGEIVLTKNLENTEKIDVRELPNGMYFIFLEKSELKITIPKKIIISR